jgi:hypothetical protein
VELSSIGVGGTPSWILVDNFGIVTDVWVGKLDSKGEAQVLDVLGNKNKSTSRG